MCIQDEKFNWNLARTCCSAEIFRAIPYGNVCNAKYAVLFQRKTAEEKTQKRKSAGCAIGKCGWFGKLDNGIHQFVMPFAWG